MIDSPIWSAICEERQRQRVKWERPHDWGFGDCSSPTMDDRTKLMVLMEEVGEVARAVFEHDEPNLMLELVQVAAVVVAWLETP